MRRVSPMFKEALPISYDAPAELKKWPSLGNQRLNGGHQPYLVSNGTLAECIQQLLGKPIRQISLYDIVTPPQLIFDHRYCRRATPPRSPCARIFQRAEAGAASGAPLTEPF